MYGDDHIQVANCYQVVASAYQGDENYRKALEFQEKSHQVLTKLYKEDDAIVKNSLATIDQFTKLSVQKEFAKKIEQQNQRPLGSNKKPKKKNPAMMNRADYMNLAQFLNLSKHPNFKNWNFQQNPAAKK